MDSTSKFLSGSPKDYNLATINEDEQCVLSQAGFKNLIGSKDGEGIHWTTDKNAELPIKINPGS
jgi:hypothetical protein